MPDDRFSYPRRWQRADRLPKTSVGGGVYVLYRDGIVVYVGHAQNFRTRLLTHRRRFSFDVAKITCIRNKRARQRLERKLLFRLRPIENRIVPSVLRPIGCFLASTSARSRHFDEQVAV